MSTTERDRVFDHDYDGIREYDNPLPAWWLWIFYATIAFSGVYFLYYQVTGMGPSIHQEYQTDMAAAAEQKAAAPVPAGPTAATLAQLAADAAQVSAGQAVFVARCAPCHTPTGAGLIGPNLTDDYWIHGDGSISAIYAVVRDGVPEKGMIPWKTTISETEMMQVTAFVHTLLGTNPPGAKEPQGNKIERPAQN
ncbi:MAG: c-type cytochrome [Candidatus Schekmanbacteria bacterium]|nr:c-type cytochrome [Candidatus Schekmanbacteria bacterium]